MWLAALEGPTHPYVGSSAACWELYGRALARAYGDPECRGVLQLAVDAYACQHPGRPERRSAQSVGIHLMTLALVLEDGADPAEGPKLHKRMVARPPFSWLEPPSNRGRIAVAALVEAPSTAAFVDETWAWAHDVWRAWRSHHATVRSWISASLG